MTAFDCHVTSFDYKKNREGCQNMPNMKNHAPDVPGFLPADCEPSIPKGVPGQLSPAVRTSAGGFGGGSGTMPGGGAQWWGQSPGASFALKMPGKPGADQRRPASTSIRPNPICPGGRGLMDANWNWVRSHLNRYWVASRRTAFSANDRAMGDEYEYLAMARARERT